LFIAAVCTQSASALSLLWDPSLPSAHIIQYKIYERKPTGYVFMANVPPSKTRYDLPWLSPGAHTFAVTAVALFQESPPSNEVTVYSTANDYSNLGGISVTNSKSPGRGGPFPSQLAISGVFGSISNVQVILHGVTHRTAQRLDVLLVGPQGQSVLLMSDVGGKSAVNGAELTFSDQASVWLGSSPIVSGTYRPSDQAAPRDTDAFPAPAPPGPYSSSLSVFNGSDPNGLWKLFVLEEGKPKGGSISSGFTIRLDTRAAPIVAVNTPVNVTSTTATLTGMINPMGRPTIYSFNYGLTEDYGNWQALQDAGAGLTAVATTLTLTGLTPDTTYYYRLMGENDVGITTSSEIIFKTLPIIDSDRDGMPDDFEVANHLNPNSDADAGSDSDGDGESNLAEFLAGTDLNDRNSSLRITAVQGVDRPSITFTTVVGKRYQLERTADLAQPTWVVVQDDVAGTGAPVTVEDLSGNGLRRAFYRAIVVP